ncbi:MAG: hypothetical protein KOO69_03055, partial [Victivallales bacterium]|nr:hypothetical protein [Victivallales bacterium]
ESVFELRQLTAEELMSARVDLAPIRVNTPQDAIAERIKEKKQEFYPIITKDIDDSELLLSAKDFFLTAADKRDDWQKNSTFPAILIPANVRLTQVLKTLKKEQVPAALLIDEYGRSIGMISIRDIYTQLTGEVETIYDQAEYSLEEADNNVWIIKGMIPLFELEDAFNIDIPEEYESKSLNGLFGEILGRLPMLGDYLELDGIKITVQKLSHRRATELKVERLATVKKEGESE